MCSDGLPRRARTAACVRPLEWLAVESATVARARALRAIPNIAIGHDATVVMGQDASLWRVAWTQPDPTAIAAAPPSKCGSSRVAARPRRSARVARRCRHGGTRRFLEAPCNGLYQALLQGPGRQGRQDRLHSIFLPRGIPTYRYSNAQASASGRGRFERIRLAPQDTHDRRRQRIRRFTSRSAVALMAMRSRLRRGASSAHCPSRCLAWERGTTGGAPRATARGRGGAREHSRRRRYGGASRPAR